MAKGAETTWDVNPKDIKKVIAQDKYDDCFSCRVTGRLSSHANGGMALKKTAEILCYRYFGSRWTRRVELLFWNGKSPATRTGYPKEWIKVQNGVEASRCGNYISDPRWNGNLASTSLSTAF
jgi:hypothetical protein